MDYVVEGASWVWIISVIYFFLQFPPALLFKMFHRIKSLLVALTEYRPLAVPSSPLTI